MKKDAAMMLAQKAVTKPAKQAVIDWLLYFLAVKINMHGDLQHLTDR